MKVLIVGDVVGRPGRNTLQAFLEKYKEDYDFVIVNGENSAAGFGITVCQLLTVLLEQQRN